MLTSDQILSEQYNRGNPKTSEIQIFFGETQIANTHRGGRKSKPFSPETDFVGLIFTGELSRMDSARVLKQGVLRTSSYVWRVYMDKTGRRLLWTPTLSWRGVMYSCNSFLASRLRWFINGAIENFNISIFYCLTSNVGEIFR